MLRASVTYRPRHLVAVYAEEHRVEILRASRHWRTWRIDGTEVHAVGQGENLFEFLQRLNIRPRDKRANALLLLLPRSFYSCHREHYPLALQSQLEEALTFDWQDNVFHETEQTLHFAGPPVSVDHHLSVPIFALQHTLLDKFHQALGAGLFRTFAVVPAALAYRAFSSPAADTGENPSVEFLGRIIDRRHVEINRYINGQLLDSLVLGLNGSGNTRMFLENLRAIGNGAGEKACTVRLFCSDVEASQGVWEYWKEQGLPVELEILQEPTLSLWVKHLLHLDQITTFETPLFLKPWQLPKALWPVVAIIVFYSLFVVWQLHSYGNLREQSRLLRKQVAQLETQWKPIEQLQARVNKFQEDKKTLSQFHAEGYPLLEILTLLTRITPEDTWINYLSLRKGQLILRGESKSAIKYLPELAKVEGFTDVRFASPVTRNPTSDEERFNVQLQIDMGKLSKAIESVPREELSSVPIAATSEASSPVVIEEEGVEEGMPSPEGSPTGRGSVSIEGQMNVQIPGKQ
ncbi:MAG: PilN domain-containing protein [Deltaproteobacteria bacterium]|nr:PilN domain-containing protein [Deltaproteobacteria bacterium]